MPTIGGSQVGAILGFNPYKRPIEVWEELHTGASNGAGPAALFGQTVEAGIVEFYERSTGRDVDRSPWRMERGFQRGTPDGWYAGELEPIGIEVKHTAIGERWGQPGTDEVPVEHWCQCQWYMDLSGWRRWEIVASIAGRYPEVFPIERDDEAVVRMREEIGQWHTRHVVQRLEPPIDHSPAFRRYLHGKYPWLRDQYKAADDATERLAAELKRVRVQLGDLEEVKAQLENELCAYIGSASGVETQLGRITWKPRKGTVLWKAVAECLFKQCGLNGTVEQYAEAFRSANTRTFRVPRKWSER